jgi:hypothetical protein
MTCDAPNSCSTQFPQLRPSARPISAIPNPLARTPSRKFELGPNFKLGVIDRSQGERNIQLALKFYF